MDTATAAACRQDMLTSVMPPPRAEAANTLTVTATYLLSEEGRKASLLTGGNGRARQEITVEVPTHRLHVVTVDLEGVARLKLRPRYEHDADQRVRRVDELPTYDVPPSVEDLFKDAARNYQLERAYDAERRAAKERRRDADRERRETVAQAFLADQTQRALVHPAPTPRRCFIVTETGRLVFDVTTDVGPARDVPPEAHRRFRADLRARRERNLQARAAQLALHEDKTRVVAAWIAAHGTPEQQARHEDGVLPIDEAIEAMTDQAFTALAGRPRYVHDGIAQLQHHLRQRPEYRDAVVAPQDLVVTGAHAKQATAAQWAAVKEVQALLPNATVALRVHTIAWKRDPQLRLPPVFGMLVTQRVEPFTFRREYAAPA
jgi:hypothetical protein